MSLVTSDANYNAETRYLEQKAIIHFPGVTPVEITRDTYLVRTSLLGEAYSGSGSTPFGGVTSNEFDMDIHNDNGIFSPTNPKSPYYKKMKEGVKVEVFIRPKIEDADEEKQYEWDPMGVYYVKDWYTEADGLLASITSYDILYTVLNGAIPSFPVFRNISFVAFMKLYFAHFGQDVIIDESLDFVIPYIYTSEHSSNKEFLAELLHGALADCFCNNQGKICIVNKAGKRSKRATLTDNDQVVNIKIKQSLNNGYDSVTVSYERGQESLEQTLLSLKELPLQPGLTDTDKLTLSTSPALSIRSIMVRSKDMAKVVSFQASAKEFVGQIQSTANTEAEIEVIGTALDTVEFTIGSAKEKPLAVSSRFIQDDKRAKTVLKYTEAYVNANMPILEMSVRGNPKFEIGDILEVSSNRYKLTYVGTLIEAKYEYEGHLTCQIVLADASMIEEV